MLSNTTWSQTNSPNIVVIAKLGNGVADHRIKDEISNGPRVENRTVSIVDHEVLNRDPFAVTALNDLKDTVVIRLKLLPYMVFIVLIHGLPDQIDLVHASIVPQFFVKSIRFIQVLFWVFKPRFLQCAALLLSLPWFVTVNPQMKTG